MDDNLARALTERGFKVYKTYRRSAKSVKEELIAANFDKESGRVSTVHASTDAGRGFREAGQGLSKREGEGRDIDYNASEPQREMEGAGRSRLSDEIRSGGRRGRGVEEEKPPEESKQAEKTERLKQSEKSGKPAEAKPVPKGKKFDT